VCVRVRACVRVSVRASVRAFWRACAGEGASARVPWHVCLGVRVRVGVRACRCAGLREIQAADHGLCGQERQGVEIGISTVARVPALTLVDAACAPALLRARGGHVAQGGHGRSLASGWRRRW